MSFGVSMRCFTMNSYCYEFHFFQLLPAPRGVGLLDCAAQTLSVRIKVFLLDLKPQKDGHFP